MAIIRLTTCNSSFEAHTLKNLLDNESIECFLTNENFSILMPGFIGMLGAGIQVMIDDKDNEKANELLSAQNQNELICPQCGSDNIVFGFGERKFRKIIAVILSILSTVPFNNIRRTYYCKNCKREFKIKNE